MLTRKTKLGDEVAPQARKRTIADLMASPALTLNDVAAVVGRPRSTIDKLLSKGRGPRTFKIGRNLYVRNVDVVAWLDNLANPPQPEPAPKARRRTRRAKVASHA